MQESFDICIGYHEVSAYKARENSIPNISTLDNAIWHKMASLSHLSLLFSSIYCCFSSYKFEMDSTNDI